MNPLTNSCATMLMALAAGVAAAGDTARISPAERDKQGFFIHRVESSLQSGPTSIRVLPPDQTEQGGRYRVLYVLPVEAGDGNRYGDGLAECRRRDLHNKHGVICVAPTFSDLPWYADHPTDSRIQQEAYFLNVVVPFIDKTYPAIESRNGRYLIGFSKSGWGAFSLLLRHPETFAKAAAWDAPVMKEKPDQFGMGPIFGTRENFNRYQLTQLLREKKTLFQAEPRLLLLGYGNFRDHHERMERSLIELEIAHRYQDGPERAHAWQSGWLRDAVAMLME